MATDGERAAQKQYWLEHSTTPTVEAMMLDSKAAEIDLMERPEVGGNLDQTKTQTHYICSK
jgi:hypothetical protein